MFDDYYFGQGTQHNYNTSTTHEHRAPTDVSVKLLKEMEQAAKDKVLASIRLNDCDIDVVIHFSREPLAMEDIYTMIYNVNGKNYSVKYPRRSMPTFDMNDYEKSHSLAKELLKVLSEDIASNLLVPAFERVDLFKLAQRY